MSGTVQNDILKEYIARGTYIYPLAPALRIVTDIFAFCRERAPEWNTISISGYHIREAGSTAVQEVAFTLANAIAYVEAALARGLAVDEFAPRLSFFLNAHNDLLEEIAKFRAARRLWARIMRERFQAQDPRSWMFRFHTQTAGSTLTAQQPNVNIVRVTLQALAAVLGGTQSLHTNARDEALALPTEASALLALRTQQILAAESGVANTIDPLAAPTSSKNSPMRSKPRPGNTCARSMPWAAWCAPSNRATCSARFSRRPTNIRRPSRSGERVVVGVNQYVEARPRAAPPLLRIDPEIERSQVERLAKPARPPRRRPRGSNAPSRGGDRAHGPQPAAGHSRRRQGLRHRGGDLRRPAPRLRRVSGVGGDLIPAQFRDNTQRTTRCPL